MIIDVLRCMTSLSTSHIEGAIMNDILLAAYFRILTGAKQRGLGVCARMVNRNINLLFGGIDISARVV